MHQLAFQPERGGGICEVLAFDPAVPDRRTGETLVQPRQSLGSPRGGSDQPLQRQSADFVSHCFVGSKLAIVKLYGYCMDPWAIKLWRTQSLLISIQYR